MMRKAWHVLTAVGLGAVAPASSVRGQPAGYEPTGLVPHALTIADFNGDGVPDLAVPAAAERKVTIFLSDGKGGFAERFGYPTGVGPSWVETGDWNGDGVSDLGVFDPATATWTLRMVGKDGTVWTATTKLGAAGDLPVTGDWDGDGTTEVGVWRPSIAVFGERSARGVTTSVVYGVPRG